MSITYEPGRLTQKYLAELACQYQNSPVLCALLTAIFEVAEEGECNLATLCDCFDLNTATGACLTALGEIAGWPRTHCAAQCVVGFGFACPEDNCPDETVVGWCSGSWFCERESSATQDYTFIDDELYRNFIRAQIQANGATGRTTDAIAVARALLGDEACLGEVQNRTLGVVVPRLLTAEERSIIILIKRLIPVSLGTEVKIFEADGVPFGFACPGDPCQPAGWCEGAFTREVNSIC